MATLDNRESHCLVLLWQNLNELQMQKRKAHMSFAGDCECGLHSWQGIRVECAENNWKEGRQSKHLRVKVKRKNSYSGIVQVVSIISRNNESGIANMPEHMCNIYGVESRTSYITQTTFSSPFYNIRMRHWALFTHKFRINSYECR